MRSLILIACTFFTINALTASDKTSDPYKYVWSEGDGKNSGMVRFWQDIDGDKKTEVFVAAKARMNKEAGLFHVFKQLGDKQYRYLGEVVLAPDQFQVLKTAKNGFRQFKTLIHVGPDGNMDTYTFNGTKFVVTARMVLKGEKTDQTFKADAIDLEDSGPMMSWNP